MKNKKLLHSYLSQKEAYFSHFLSVNNLITTWFKISYEEKKQINRMIMNYNGKVNVREIMQTVLPN